VISLPRFSIDAFSDADANGLSFETIWSKPVVLFLGSALLKARSARTSIRRSAGTRRRSPLLT
jgi:hypothetical protein